MTPVEQEIQTYRIMHRCQRNSDGSCQKCRFVDALEESMEELKTLRRALREKERFIAVLDADLRMAHHIIAMAREARDWSSV